MHVGPSDALGGFTADIDQPSTNRRGAAEARTSAMCRLLGIAAAAPYEFGLLLREAPHSMARLSREHRDGWGVATHEGAAGYGWAVHKSVRVAEEDPSFAADARRARGRMLVAHVRQKTVGPTRLSNTHPFSAGPWVFAHNGTVRDLTFLEERTSPARRIEREDATDSEKFFGYLLSQLDERELFHAPASVETDEVVRRAVLAATERSDFGTLDFLLSNGTTLYAGRFGRPLYLMERTPVGHAPVAPDGAVPVSARHCVAIASEPLTDEPWTTIEQGTLLRLDVSPSPHWLAIA